MAEEPGSLQAAGVHLKEEDGVKMKKNNEAAKALLDSISSMAPTDDPSYEMMGP